MLHHSCPRRARLTPMFLKARARRTQKDCYALSDSFTYSSAAIPEGVVHDRFDCRLGVFSADRSER